MHRYLAIAALIVGSASSRASADCYGVSFQDTPPGPAVGGRVVTLDWSPTRPDPPGECTPPGEPGSRAAGRTFCGTLETNGMWDARIRLEVHHRWDEAGIMTAAEGHPEVIIEGRFYRQQVECGPPPLAVGQQRAFLVTEAGDHFTMLTERSMPPAVPPPVRKASGCAGCSTSEPGWLLVLAVAALRRRRRRGR